MAAPGNTGTTGRPGEAPGAGTPGPPKRRVWWLYTRVMVVQIVALVLLWLLQATYGS